MQLCQIPHFSLAYLDSVMTLGKKKKETQELNFSADYFNSHYTAYDWEILKMSQRMK